MADSISFTVYGTPAPQGSMKAFVIGGRARVTTDNRKLKPYRQEVAGAALTERAKANFVMAGKHIPVEVCFRFFFERPPSIPKKRLLHVVKPDLDKLLRSTTDALTGILFADDSQIVCYGNSRKDYGSPARVEITVRWAQAINEAPTPTLFKEPDNGRTMVLRQDSAQDDHSISDESSW
jgi:crossover junction endodeoxyribonuclease RusA